MDVFFLNRWVAIIVTKKTTFFLPLFLTLFFITSEKLKMSSSSSLSIKLTKWSSSLCYHDLSHPQPWGHPNYLFLAPVLPRLTLYNKRGKISKPIIYLPWFDDASHHNRPIWPTQCCSQFKSFGNKTFCSKYFHVI